MNAYILEIRARAHQRTRKRDQQTCLVITSQMPLQIFCKIHRSVEVGNSGADSSAMAVIYQEMNEFHCIMVQFNLR